jgi:hypothetical protein
MNQQTILPKVSGNRFYTIYGNDYTMRVLDAITGAQISSLYIDVADPVSINVAKGTIYVCLDKGIWALDSVTLATKWVRGRYMYASSCQSGSSPVITDSIVHVVSAISGNVEQMRTRDGGFIDNYGKDLVGGDVTVVNSVSYFGSRDIFNVLNGFVYGVQLPSRESWRGPVVADYSTTPCVVTKSGKMYRAGDLY